MALLRKGGHLVIECQLLNRLTVRVVEHMQPMGHDPVETSSCSIGPLVSCLPVPCLSTGAGSPLKAERYSQRGGYDGWSIDAFGWHGGMSLEASLRHLCPWSCTMSALAQVEGFEVAQPSKRLQGGRRKARIKGPFLKRTEGSVDTGEGEEGGER